MGWNAPPADLTGHVVICNCSEKVRGIVEELHAREADGEIDVVLVVQDRSLWEQHGEWHPDADNPVTREHFFVLHSGGVLTDRRAMTGARIQSARIAVILADPLHGQSADARTLLMALAIERFNPSVHTIVEMLNSSSRVHIRGSMINEVVCMAQLTEQLIAQSCITPGVKDIFLNLLSNAAGTNNAYLVAVPLRSWDAPTARSRAHRFERGCPT